MNPPERKDIERLADLAGLEVDAATMASLTGELTAIIQYVSQIEAAFESCDEISGSADPTDQALRLRDDEIDATMSIGDPGAFAPAFEDGFFLSPVPESLGEG